MVMSDEIHYLSLLDVSERIRRRELTSKAVASLMLDRIERLDGKLNSFLLVLADTALAQADQADREIAAGFWRGPLHGVPIGIKDLICTKDVPTTAGMHILRDFRPDEDATVVKRLKNAGAVLIGKLNMTEGATFDYHPKFPRPENPWSAAHWPGLSSSGSGVATAAGLCFGAIGSDTGGSIRMPCAANGISGIKPTWGLVSRHGVMPLSQTLDHIGPMARSAADAAAMLGVIAGHDPADPTTLAEPFPDYRATLDNGVSDMVIGVDWQYATEDVAADVVDSIHHAVEVFRRLGAQIRDISFPSTASLATETRAMRRTEFAVSHEPYFPMQAEDYGPGLRSWLEDASNIDARAVAKGYQARDRFTGKVCAIFRDIDLMLTPGLPVVTPTWKEFDAIKADASAIERTLLRYTSPFNVAGIPTITLPSGFTPAGLPIAIQLVAWRSQETLLCDAGYAFQQATGFHTRRPPLD
jgi:amidase